MSELRRRGWCVLLGVMSVACGARTGLRVDDDAPRPDGVDVTTADVTDVTDAPDAVDIPDVTDVTDVVDIPDVCVSRRYALSAQPAEALFLLDRSQSMNRALEGGVSRRQTLVNVLQSTLPAFEGHIAMGSLHFPSGALSCSEGLPLTVGIGSPAATVVSGYSRAGLTQGTPTAAAVDLAVTALAARRRPNVSQSIVLATDGAPGCNSALDPATCTCAESTAGTCGASQCLDDTRTLAAITRARDGGVDVYVIGIDDPAQPVLLATLDRMAVAGGRARAGGAGVPRYYSVRRMSDLRDALDTIRRSLSACVVRYAGPASDLDGLHVRVDGVERPRDATRTDGWDFTSADRREITLYGAACAAAGPDVPATAETRCDDR